MMRLDEVKFFKAAATAVEQSLNLTPIIRAATGLSNGMASTNLVTCTGGDFFDLGAGVSFQLPADLTGCQAAPGYIYSEFHGTNDTVVDFETPRAFLNAGNAAQVPTGLARLRGCNMTPEMSELNSNTTCQTFSGCTGGGIVQMCTVENGSHVLYPNIAEPNFPDAFANLMKMAIDVKNARTAAPAPAAGAAPAN
jgi:poly(3-hydroxybutyrate) depolymerase